MTENLINYYGPILKKYNLKADFIEEFGKVKKVYTQNGVFALKTISAKRALEFPTIIRKLYQSGYTKIVPIHATIDNHFLTLYDNKYHYLMPWYRNELGKERDDRHQLLFKELARLHSYSSKEFEVQEEEISEHYQFHVKQWDNRKEFLEAFITKCENKWYMSPFELQYCTIYHDTVQGSNFAYMKLEEWYEKVKETKKNRTVINHGKPSVRHFLFDQNGSGYFCNLEDSKLGTPVNDLVLFFYRTLHTYPIQSYDCFEWFSTYRKYYPLKEEELLLFLSYMAFPEPIYRCVYKYENSKNSLSERQFVASLQRAYWQLKNIEFFLTTIVEDERRRKEQEELELNQEENQSHT